MGNQGDKQSVFSKFLAFLQSIFNRKKGKGITTSGPKPLGQTTSSSGESVFSPDSTSTTSAPDPSVNWPDEVKEHMDEASFKYGDATITIAKSKQYLAVKKNASAIQPASNLRVANTAQPEDGENLGDFELVKPNDETPEAVEAKLDSLRQSPTIDVGTHVYHHTKNKDAVPLVPSGELYIQFKEGTSEAESKKLLLDYHLAIDEKRDGNIYIVHVTELSPNPIKTTVALQKSSLVKTAEPDLRSPVSFESFVMPSDDLLDAQWHLENKGSHGNWSDNAFRAGADAKVVAAWKHLDSLGSDDIVVAVIDDGFDLNHPDLKGDGTKIVSPWDFETSTPNASTRPGNNHGTPCAGVAVGAADGSLTVGAAPNAKLMPLRFAYISDSQIEKWFNYAANNGADVVSCSWGSHSPEFVLSTRMISAISNCASHGRNGKGCVIVFASGNSSRSISNPGNSNAIMGFATHPNVIAVSACNSKDEFSSYSNFGSQISICASSNGNAGAGVTAPDATGVIPLSTGGFAFNGYDAGDTTSSFGGTSSACPLVAGICALVLSVDKNLTSPQVKTILESSTTKIGSASDYDANGHSIKFGYGKANALKAVKLTQGHSLPVEPIRTPEIENPPVAPPTPPNSGETPENVPVDKIQFSGAFDGNFSRAGEEHLYMFSLNHRLTVSLDSPVGEANSDFDLYFRKGQRATTNAFDIKSNRFGSDEEIDLTGPELSEYYSLVHAYQGTGGFNFAAKLHPSATTFGAHPLPLVAGSGGMLMKTRRDFIAYSFSNRKKIRVFVSAKEDPSRNFDLYIKQGSAPQWNVSDAKAITSKANEEVELTPRRGDYFVLVRSEKGSGDYRLTINVE